MQLGGYVVNRKDGTEGLTIAGLLMFGKGLPVRERFDYLRMDYIDKSNLIGDQRYSDRLTYDGTWENNLFNFIRMVCIPFLPHLWISCMGDTSNGRVSNRWNDHLLIMEIVKMVSIL